MAPDDKNPPLVSPQSPSYERARAEQAHPAPLGPAQTTALLNGLAAAEHEAERACRTAAHNSKDRGLAINMRLQIAEHKGRAQALDEMIRALGGSPPRDEEVPQTHSKEVERAGTDAAMQEVLNKMGVELRAQYAAAVADPNISQMHKDALQRLAPG